MKNIKLVVIIIGGLVLVSLVGYFIFNKLSRKIGETAVENMINSQTGGKVDIDTSGENGKVTIKMEDGTVQYSTGGNVKLPDGFPQELIIATDAKLIGASSANNGNTVIYQTNSEQDTLFSDYITKLTSLGWKKEMEVDTAEGKMLNFTKDKFTAVISIEKNGSEDTSMKNIVNVILSKEE